jgi:putative membrane protein
MCDDQPGLERFKVMERRLYIMTHIGAVGATIFGVWLLIGYAWQSYSHTGWLQVKLLMVIFLYAYHIYCGKLVKDFRQATNRRSDKFYRLFNEIPVIPLFVVVILVEVKPF